MVMQSYANLTGPGAVGSAQLLYPNLFRAASGDLSKQLLAYVQENTALAWQEFNSQLTQTSKAPASQFYKVINLVHVREQKDSAAPDAVDPTHSLPFDVYTHVSFSPAFAKPPVRVLVGHRTAGCGVRDNPLAKNTQWCIHRSQYTALMKDNNYNEILLVGSRPGGASKSNGPSTEDEKTDSAGGDRCVWEGLTANLFVVMDDKLYTAKDGVYLGGARVLVLNLCKELGIPVLFEAPRLADWLAGRWQGAFLTSNPLSFSCGCFAVLME